MSEAQPPEKKAQEPQKKLYDGYATKEELEARNAQFRQEVEESEAEWVRLHGRDTLPKVN
jgi:hypothetical protein